MTTNKPNVRRYDDMGCPEQICRVEIVRESDDGDYVLYEDYEALQAENEKLRGDVSELVEALEDCIFALEPYDDIKPRDWKTDRQNLRRVHQSARLALAALSQPAADPEMCPSCGGAGVMGPDQECSHCKGTGGVPAAEARARAIILAGRGEE